MGRQAGEEKERENSYGDGNQRNSGAGMGLAAIAFALLFIVGPIAALSFGAPIPTLATIFLVGFGVLLLLVGMIVVVITKLYVKTAADEAIVRTGMGGQKVVIDGGIMFIPVVHKAVSVSLRTMRLDVNRNGKDALITGDSLRADLAAEFFIKVAKSPEAVINAATSLGERSTHPDNVRSLLEQKLVNALRTVAATKTLEQLNRDRTSFVDEIQKIVSMDLAHNGLTLESVTISALDQTPTSSLRADNVFDAKGLKTIAEITNDQLVQKNQIEASAAKKIAEQNLERDRFLLDQSQSLATATAAQKTEIANANAQRQQEAASYAAEQTRKSQTAQVASDQAIKEAEIAREQALAVAAAYKNQAEQVALVKAQQAQQVAQVEQQKIVDLAQRERAVAVAAAEQKKLVAEVAANQAQQVAMVASEQAQEVANREKQIAIAEAEQRRAAAEALKLAAENEAEKNRQAVKTTETVAIASREKEKKIIDQEAASKQEQIKLQVNADAEAYAMMKKAEGQKMAAQNAAEAIKTEAEAKRDAAKANAEGMQAEQMVPVGVAKAQVDVNAAQVQVKKTDMEIQTNNAAAAIQKELALAQIAADRDVRIAQAQAMGQAFAGANMTIWGSPETAAQMTKAFMDGQGMAQRVDGFMDALPASLKATVASAAQAIASKVTGTDTSKKEPAPDATKSE